MTISKICRRVASENQLMRDYLFAAMPLGNGVCGRRGQQAKAFSQVRALHKLAE